MAGKQQIPHSQELLLVAAALLGDGSILTQLIHFLPVAQLKINNVRI